MPYQPDCAPIVKLVPGMSECAPPLVTWSHANTLVVRVIHLIVRYHLTWSHANLYGDYMPPFVTLSCADL